MKDEHRHIRDTFEPMISNAVARRDAAALHAAVSDATDAIASMYDGYDSASHVDLYGMSGERPVVRLVEAVLAGADVDRSALAAHYAGRLRGYVRSELLSALIALRDEPSIEAARRVVDALPGAKVNTPARRGW